MHPAAGVARVLTRIPLIALIPYNDEDGDGVAEHAPGDHYNRS